MNAQKYIILRKDKQFEMNNVLNVWNTVSSIDYFWKVNKI